MSTDSGRPTRAGALPVPIGGLVADKYRVDGVLGRGGMGVVVAATDLELERKVAIKFVERQDEQAAARFLREARSAARVDSEHVTRVFEVGRLEQVAPYIVMEQLEGEDLAKLLEAGRVPVSQAVGYLMQVCEALAQAHAARIVHRDLKPGNLFLHRRGDGSRVVKVLDFGISKTLEGTALTQSQAIVGSPQYLAPEQIEHPEKVDHRTDIWGLGVVAYELISGERPFRGRTMVELCISILTTQPEPLPSHLGVPEGLEAAIRRALAKSMEARFSSVLELAEALAPFSDPEGALLMPAITRAAARRMAAPSTTPTSAVLAMDRRAVEDTVDNGLEQRAARTSSRRDAWTFASLGILVVGGALILLRGQGSMPPAAPDPPELQALAASGEPSAPAVPAANAGSVAPPAPSPSGEAPAAAPEQTPSPAQITPPVTSPRKPRAEQKSPAKPLAAPAPAHIAKAQPAAEVAASCRVLEVIENNRRLEPAAGRVTFEWARRLCQGNPRPKGAVYNLSDSGISVKCACE